MKSKLQSQLIKKHIPMKRHLIKHKNVDEKLKLLKIQSMDIKIWRQKYFKISTKSQSTSKSFYEEEFEFNELIIC